jgi:alkyl hydroperoxide reductase subunit AhpC
MNTITTLPSVGDLAPRFKIDTPKGDLQFPEYSAGHWCIFFAHPANFSSAWTMYSTFLAFKERWFDARNTKMVALSTLPIRQDDWSGKVQRYLGIYLGAPVIEDLDATIAHMYGMASGRKRHPDHNRLAFIIDPDGIIRLILDNLEPSIEHAIIRLEKELDRLQGTASSEDLVSVNEPIDLCQVDVREVFDPEVCKNYKPAYFRRDKLNTN